MDEKELKKQLKVAKAELKEKNAQIYDLRNQIIKCHMEHLDKAVEDGVLKRVKFVNSDSICYKNNEVELHLVREDIIYVLYDVDRHAGTSLSRALKAASSHPRTYESLCQIKKYLD